MCIKSNITEIKRLRCDLNESLTLDFCLQNGFTGLVRRDLENHGCAYSQKTKDLLNELISLSKLSRTLLYFSLVTLNDQIGNITLRLQSGFLAGVCYWMETKESELLLKTIHEMKFSEFRWEDTTRGLAGTSSEVVRADHTSPRTRFIYA